MRRLVNSASISGTFFFALLLLLLGPGAAWSQTAKKAGKICHIWVTNTGAASIDVKCERYENVLADSSVNYFCWDACYAPAVNVSAGTLPIAPGDTNILFYSDYNANAGTGTSIITYCFYVNGIPADSACLTVSFSDKSPADSLYGTLAINSAVGIELSKVVRSNTFLGIQPNPATDKVAISYVLVSGAEGELVIRNMLGKIVYRAAIYGTGGVAAVPVFKLPNGVYFCTLAVDKQVLQTERLVVNR